jgi:hypothetical protein
MPAGDASNLPAGDAPTGDLPARDVRGAALAADFNEPLGEDVPSRRGRTLAVIGALVVVLAIAIAIVFALRSAAGRAAGTDNAAGAVADAASTPSDPIAEPGAGTAPTTGTSNDGATSAGPGGSAAPTLAASGQPGNPEAGDTGVLRSGTVRLTVVAGQTEEAFDLDTGTKADPSAPGSDISAAAVGLTATNGARFAAWTQAGSPNATGCAATPEARWSTTVPVEALLPGANTCVRTSEGRLASFTTRPGPAVTDGRLYTTYLDFTVWKKLGD